jgi:hypothetical protein
MTRHNRYGFKKGDVAILDADYRNWSKVIIVELTSPSEMFATVYPCGDQEKDAWQVMTNRLSPEKY